MESEQAQRFLQTFFGRGNRLALQDVLSGQQEEEPLFSSWLTAWQRDPTTPVVLPRRWPNGAVSYYALASSDRQWRELGVRLRAFLGPSYSDFDPRPPHLDPADPVEQAIAALPDARVYRFSLHHEHRRRGRQALRLLFELGRSQPGVDWQPPPPTGRLLRDFSLALHIGDAPAARAQLEFLRAGGRLNVWNLHFLEIRILAAEGAWRELRVSPHWSAALGVHRRPMAVTRAMIEALYHTELAPLVQQGDMAGALQRFSADIWPGHHALFRALPPNPSPPIRDSFLLAAAAASPPRTEVRDALLEAVREDDPARDQVAALAALCQPIATPGPCVDLLQEAQRAFDADDLNRALDLADQAPAGRKQLQLLLLCGSAIGSLEAERVVLRAMQKASTSDRQAVLQNRMFRQYWQTLSTAEPEVPEGWLAWLERLEREPTWPAAVSMAERGVAEWSTTPLRQNADVRKRFADLLGGVSSTAPLSTRNALPHLLQAFQPDGVSESAFARIYQEMLNILAFDERIGTADAQVVLELALALLHAGVSAREYQDLTDAIDMIWERKASIQWLDWMLDVLDILAEAPATNPSLRKDLLAKTVSKAAGFAQRITPHQRQMLLSFCEEYHQPDWGASFQPPSDAPPVLDPLAVGLRNRTVALYSLTESAAKRASRLLKARCPTVRVQLSHDHVGSDRLLALSRNADLFVIATRSAKHAATNFIEDNRPPLLPTLMARGKGCSSLILALEEHLITH